MKTPAEKKFTSLIATIIVTVTVSIVLLAAGWAYVLSISSNTAKMMTEVANSKNENNALADLQIRYHKVQFEKPMLLQAVPNSKEISSFITNVEDLAKKDGISINNSIIGQSKGKVDELSQTIKKQGYNELQIKYSISGNYQNLQAFIKDMKNVRRINNISNLTIMADESNAKTNPDAVKANFTLSIYIEK